MSKLYELTGQYKNLAELLDNPNLPQDDIKQALNGVQADISEKVDGIGKLIKNMESDAQSLKNEEERLYKRRASLQNNIESVKNYLYEQISQLQDKKVKTSLFTFYVQSNAPSVAVNEVEYIPKHYFKDQEPILDKKRLLDDLKNGVKIDGVVLQQTESLRMK